MRHFLILFFVFLAFHTSSHARVASVLSNASTINNRTMGISLSPLALINMSIEGKYTLKLLEPLALIMPFKVQYFVGIGNFVPKLENYSAGAGLKYFFASNVFAGGFYSEVDLTGGYASVKPKGRHSFTTPFLNTTVMLGYGWVLGDRFTINFAGGALYNRIFSDETRVRKTPVTAQEKISEAASGVGNGFAPAFELSLGYIW